MLCVVYKVEEKLFENTFPGWYKAESEIVSVSQMYRWTDGTPVVILYTKVKEDDIEKQVDVGVGGRFENVPVQTQQQLRSQVITHGVGGIICYRRSLRHVEIQCRDSRPHATGRLGPVFYLTDDKQREILNSDDPCSFSTYNEQTLSRTWSLISS